MRPELRAGHEIDQRSPARTEMFVFVVAKICIVKNMTATLTSF